MAIIKSTEPGTLLLGLGPKLHPSNIQCMPNKDLYLIQAESSVPKASKQMKGSGGRENFYISSLKFVALSQMIHYNELRQRNYKI